MTQPFQNRREAGRLLARKLRHYSGREAVVLGLPRGGVVVAFEVAEALRLPLDVLIVRKLGVPGHKELAMGAIASGGVRVVDERIVQDLGIEPADIEYAVRLESEEIRRREMLYRGDRAPLEVKGKTVILVDDGLATGSTMMAAVRAIRRSGPRHITVAVPVGAPSTCAAFKSEADEVICAETPPDFQAVGLWYLEFGQTSDEEVKDLLRAAAH